MLETLLAAPKPPLYLTPVTREHDVAAKWLAQFEGAGLDGVIAKPLDSPYLPGKRAMLKVKHARTADCVVAGFRWYKDTTDAVGSLLLGLYDDRGVLHHVGVTSAFTMADAQEPRAASSSRCARTRSTNHPWRGMGRAKRRTRRRRMPGGQSRWTGRQGLVVGAAAHRARVRGQVRPSAGRSLPPRDAFPALAARQAAGAIAATTSSRSRRLSP